MSRCCPSRAGASTSYPVGSTRRRFDVKAVAEDVAFNSSSTDLFAFRQRLSTRLVDLQTKDPDAQRLARGSERGMDPHLDSSPPRNLDMCCIIMIRLLNLTCSLCSCAVNAVLAAESLHPSQGWQPSPHHLTKQELWQTIQAEARADAVRISYFSCCEQYMPLMQGCN